MESVSVDGVVVSWAVARHTEADAVSVSVSVSLLWAYATARRGAAKRIEARMLMITVWMRCDCWVSSCMLR